MNEFLLLALHDVAICDGEADDLSPSDVVLSVLVVSAVAFVVEIVVWVLVVILSGVELRENTAIGILFVEIAPKVVNDQIVKCCVPASFTGCRASSGGPLSRY